jgi:ABC-2 type transport system permease protein
MLHSVFSKSLWEQRRALVGWTIGITAVGVFYASFFPAVSGPEISEAMENMAPELMEALGFTAISTPAGYLGSTTFGLLGPVLMIVMGTWLGTRAIAGDEESGRLDVLLAHPVSRVQVAVERFAALAVAMGVVSLVLLAALLAVSGVAQLETIGAANLAAACLHLAVLGTFFGGLALAVGAATGSRALCSAVAAAVGVVGYFANTLAAQIDAVSWAQSLSPFRYYSGGRPLVNGVQVVDLGILAAAAIALVAIGTALFSKRDVGV